ncbi:MAG TPA: patatin-like phospholipase family protein [Rhodothermales bacterium]|nr:patatin-like phospholipase family protein [Rhodothermales bacterium]
MQRDVKIGLACAGGGMEGSIYEIGALCALDEVLDGAQMHELDVYVGVSAGAMVTACLANGISARTMSRAIISRAEDPSLNITPDILFAPAFGEYARRLTKLPGAVVRSVWDYVRRPLDLSPLGALVNLGSVVPVGVFDNRPIEQHLAKAFSAAGRTNDFRRLHPILRVVAVDVDTAEVVVFGTEETAHVPISKAVQASTALPGLYLPVKIEGASYIDGVARRTVHSSAALEAGARLLFCINPIVPVNTEAATSGRTPSLVDHGLPTVLSQAFRTVIHSRMRTGFRSYKHLYPDATTILIEPTPEDVERIFSNLFSFSNRYAVCEHAYQTTRRQLCQRADEIEPILEQHGLGLRRNILADEDRTLYGDLAPRSIAQEAGNVLDETYHVLDRLEQALEKMESMEG